MLKDKERSYFGIGWEYCRQDKKMEENPFSAADHPYAHGQFKEGFIAYRASKTYDPSLIANFDVSKFPAANNILE